MISVIIAHDPEREDLLSRCLRSIVIDAESDHVDYELIVESEGNIAFARNKAAQNAKGEILVFFDDDVMLRPGCLRELIAPFQDPSVAVVGGVNVAFDKIDFAQQISASLFSSPFMMARSVSRYTPRGIVRETDESELISCNLAIRKQALIDVGGFPENIIPCEENVLLNRIQKTGLKMLYNPFAVVYHRRPKIFMEYARQIFEYGAGRGMMLRKGVGSAKMLWKPNKKWLYYLAGGFIHYVSYISGVVYGYLIGEVNQ